MAETPPPSSGTPDDLPALIARSRRILAFTGAGISTESGIPDFRSPGAVWTRYDPRDLTFDRYVASADVRAASWQMRRDLAEQRPEPNAAHHALVELERAGRLHGLVTQNIDGLHQAAGSSDVLEMHGSGRHVMCIGRHPRDGSPAGCGFRTSLEWALERIDDGEPDPACPECGGLVKSATVSFGQVLDGDVVDRAYRLARGADLVLAVGSSLQVYPAADLPIEGCRAGAGLAIVNDEATPLDGLADLVVRGRAGTVLPPAVRAAVA